MLLDEVNVYQGIGPLRLHVDTEPFRLVPINVNYINIRLHDLFWYIEVMAYAQGHDVYKGISIRLKATK